MIEIKASKYGRGVFATETIKEGTVVELAPFIKIFEKQLESLKKTALWVYVYEVKRGAALALGVGSLFNHSFKSNVEFNILERKKIIKFTASKNIRKGSQLFIDYGYDPKKYWDGKW